MTETLHAGFALLGVVSCSSLQTEMMHSLLSTHLVGCHLPVGRCHSLLRGSRSRRRRYHHLVGCHLPAGRCHCWLWGSFSDEKVPSYCWLSSPNGEVPLLVVRHSFSVEKVPSFCWPSTPRLRVTLLVVRHSFSDGKVPSFLMGLAFSDEKVPPCWCWFF